MSMTDEPPCAEENLLFARAELASDIASILNGDDDSPEALAHMFIALRDAIAGGLEGTPAVHTSSVQGSPSTIGSVSSLMAFTLPVPSHTFF